ncbi:MAG TPA: DinB family protein, partial [Bryobacteraceae bacterium]
EDTARRLSTGRWSKKEILGHLIDSAGNNHQRFVRLLIAPSLDFLGYRQVEWVAAQDYASESWPDLVNLWLLFNRHLLHVIRRIPEEALERPCVIQGERAGSFADLVRGYVDHMEHHLAQILE